MKPLIYVCSPFRGDVKKNTQKIRDYCRYIYKKGCIPISSILLFVPFLDDDNPVERMAGIEMGTVLALKCDEVWVFGDKITEGMEIELAAAKTHGIRVVRINE